MFFPDEPGDDLLEARASMMHLKFCGRKKLPGDLAWGDASLICATTKIFLPVAPHILSHSLPARCLKLLLDRSSFRLEAVSERKGVNAAVEPLKPKARRPMGRPVAIEAPYASADFILGLRMMPEQRPKVSAVSLAHILTVSIPRKHAAEEQYSLLLRGK